MTPHAALLSHDYGITETISRKSNMASRVRIFEEDFMPSGSECTRGGPFDYPKCAPGLWCVGNSPARCMKRSKVGGKCGTEYEVCGTGQTCRSGRCAMIAGMDVNYLRQGAVCRRGQGKRVASRGWWCVVGRWPKAGTVRWVVAA